MWIRGLSIVSQLPLAGGLVTTDLHYRDQVRHGIEVAHGEIDATPGFDLPQRFHNFNSESLLDLPLLRELPEGAS